MFDLRPFAPAGILVAGLGMLLSVQAQRELALQQPLDSLLPDLMAGAEIKDVTMDPEQFRVVGVTSYLNRVYTTHADTDSSSVLGLYVGYYDSQRQGKTAHSPKNCLPGAGWEALDAGYRTVNVPGGPVQVNRYVIANGGQQAIVYYWYQGRGRVVANEYAVKLDLLKDAAIRRRTDEALVRLVIPVRTREGIPAADALGQEAAARLIPALREYLPS